MKRITFTLSLFFALALLLASCSSTTLIESNPPKAKIYFDGTYMGVTPYYHTDSRIVGSSFTIKLEKEGYQPIVSSITKDEEPDLGAIIGGCFFAVPFLWTMKYQAVHSYELKPLNTENAPLPENSVAPSGQKTPVDKLRELKQLLDDKIITPAEFETEKAKIMEKGLN